MQKRSTGQQLPASDPVEALRNRLLRRMDWRFLLPQSTPQRAVCFAPALGEGMRTTMGAVDADVREPGS
jgi:hypothetical protein